MLYDVVDLLNSFDGAGDRFEEPLRGVVDVVMVVRSVEEEGPTEQRTQLSHLGYI